jgi:uncharacterized protein
MEKYILDTNLFFNMEAGLNMGSKTEDVIKNLTTLIQSLKQQKKAEFFMSPKIVDEILSFFDDKEQQFLKDLFASVIIKSPDLNNITLSANVFAQFVEETRTRAYRGMNVGDEEIRKAGNMFMGKETMSKMDFEKTIGPVVKTFRERYRQATRVNFIDSLADLEIILLAKEQDGYLVTTDEGVTRWGRSFGVKEMPAQVFGTKMQELMK